ERREKMRRIIYVWGICLLIVPEAVCAHEKPAQLTEETWEAAHIDGAKAGFFHTTVHLVEIDGIKRYRTRTELDLTFKRYNSPVRLRLEQSTDETPDGKVVAVAMKQGQEKGPQL